MTTRSSIWSVFYKAFVAIMLVVREKESILYATGLFFIAYFPCRGDFFFFQITAVEKRLKFLRYVLKIDKLVHSVPSDMLIFGRTPLGIF